MSARIPAEQLPPPLEVLTRDYRPAGEPPRRERCVADVLARGRAR